MNYNEFAEAVYNWLKAKNEKDQTFCFSTRRKAAKGAERNYFIGTQKSNYFATTLWWIPTSFPGSSSDLVNLIFTIRNQKYHAYIQFVQTKQPGDKQNELALLFIQELREFLKSNNISLAWDADKVNKMEYFSILLCNEFDSLEGFFAELDIKLGQIIPLIDQFLDEFKIKHLEFDAGRIDQVLFQNVFQKKLHERRNKEIMPEKTNPEKKELVDYKTIKDTMPDTFPLNLILFGPPGTGKTYSSLEKAVEITDNVFYKENIHDRESISQQFSDLLIREMGKDTEAQIAFCTFHQSMNYEDFIEGLKPITKDGEVRYEVVDGIFKRISNIARKNYLSSLESNLLKEDFDYVLGLLIEEWEQNKNMKFSMKSKGYEYTVTEFTESSIRFKKASGGTGHTLSLATLEDYYYGQKDIRPGGVGIYYPGILEKLVSYSTKKASKNELKNYVIIIDEINRGNVSQIFGELITCIESSKRTGNENEKIEVLLPYSKTSFSVPPNLYLIGTMNTADRSVEALDTALRRRFEFEEMTPDLELLSTVEVYANLWQKHMHKAWDDPNWEHADIELSDLLGAEVIVDENKIKDLYQIEMEEWYDKVKSGNYIKFNGLELAELLHTINQRIEVLLDREHLIGHSYFMNVFSWSDLNRTIYKNIIPLLQEYFYGDYGKIGLVLGSGFIRIKKDDAINKVKFSQFKYDNIEDLYRTVYEIIPQEEIEIKNAIRLLLNNE